MLADLEPQEPEGWRRAAWRHLDVVLTGARERVVAHRGAGHVDEVAIFSDRTLVLHRRVEGPLPGSAVSEVRALYRTVVGAPPGDDVGDMVLELVRAAALLAPDQRTHLRRLFADVGYPPIDPAAMSRRIAKLLGALAAQTKRGERA